MDNTERPQAVITLKVADDRDKVIWVTQSVTDVVARIEDANKGYGSAPLIELTRWRAMSTDAFYTRFDNVVSVEAYR